MPSPTDLGSLGPPPPTGEYADLADIKLLLQAYARDNGYAIRRRHFRLGIGAADLVAQRDEA
jgi:hypothetical protein